MGYEIVQTKTIALLGLLAISLTACNVFKKQVKEPGYRKVVGMSLVREWTSDEFLYPLSLAVRNESLSVVDSQKRSVYMFDLEGNLQQHFGDGELSLPTGVAYGDVGQIYVADYGADYIVEFSPAGQVQARWGGNGKAPGKFRGCMGIATDNQWAVYVVEFDGHRVQKFTSAGEPMAAWGEQGSSPGQFNFAVDLIVAGDTLYVADTHNYRIQAFSLDGKFQRVWGESGTWYKHFDDPIGITGDRFGNMFIADAGNHRIQVYDNAGQHLLTFDFDGRWKHELHSPTDVVVSREGWLFVADAPHRRIQNFRIEYEP